MADLRRRNTDKSSSPKRNNPKEELSLPPPTQPTSKFRRFLRLIVLAALIFVVVGIIFAVSAGIYHNIKLKEERETLKRVKESFKGESVPFRNGALFTQCSGPKQGSSIDIWLINGLGGLLSDWEFIFNKLGQLPGARICRFDPSSFGFSDTIDHDDEESFQFYVDQLRHLYTHFAAESQPKILVGHSLGGLTARIVTHMYAAQDNIVGTVLVDATTENTFDLFLKPYAYAFSYLFDILGSLEYIGFSRMSSGYGIHPMESYLQLLDVPSREITQHFYSTPEHWASVKHGFTRMERGCEWAKTVVNYFPLPHTTQIRVISATLVESFMDEELAEGPSPSAMHIQEQRRVWESYDESIRGQFILAENCTHFLHLQHPAYVLRAVQDIYDGWISSSEEGKKLQQQN